MTLLGSRQSLKDLKMKGAINTLFLVCTKYTLTKVSKMFLIKVESSLQLPDTHNTVAVRASLAQEYVKVNIHLMNKTRPIFFLNVNGNTIVKLVTYTSI